MTSKKSDGISEATALGEPRRSIRKRKVISYAEQPELLDDGPVKKAKVTTTHEVEVQVHKKKTTIKKSATAEFIDLTAEAAGQAPPPKAIGAVSQQTAFQEPLLPPIGEKRLRK
jgi:hypothetical protein